MRVLWKSSDVFGCPRMTQMVERGGIEPPSISPTLQDLRTYPPLLFSPHTAQRAGKARSQPGNFSLNTPQTRVPHYLMSATPKRSHQHEPLGFQPRLGG